MGEVDVAKAATLWCAITHVTWVRCIVPFMIAPLTIALLIIARFIIALFSSAHRSRSR